jgi:hypothetical protein
VNNIGFPLVLAQAFDALSAEHGKAFNLAGLRVEMHAEPTVCEDVSRAHQRQTSQMQVQLRWEDEELGWCAAELDQRAVDVIDRESFERQVIEPACVNRIRAYVDMPGDGEIERARASADLAFDEDGEIIVAAHSPSLHDPMAQGMLVHALQDRLRQCYRHGWQILHEAEQRPDGPRPQLGL